MAYLDKRPGYVYKISFPSGHFYYGFKIGKPEETKDYFGSPVTHKEFWTKFPILCKEIIKTFNNYEEAKIFEDQIIKETWTEDLSLNECCGFNYSLETCRKGSTNQKKALLEKTNGEFSNYFQLPEIKEQIKQTNFERYGVEHPMQNTEIAQKSQKNKEKNLIESYNVVNVFQLDSVKEQIKKTNFEKYGVEHYSRTEKAKEYMINRNPARIRACCIVCRKETNISALTRYHGFSCFGEVKKK